MDFGDRHSLGVDSRGGALLKDKPDFIPRLESLRGLAAVSVVAYHAFDQFLDTSVTGLAPVVLFFVLSGFVLARSLARDPGLARFVRHRIFRLFPAAIAVVLLLTFLHAQFGYYHGFPPDFSTFNVLLNALMLKHDINGPMWSMTAECLATPIIPATFWLCLRHGWRATIPAIAILFALSFVGQFTHLLGGFSNLGPLYAFLVGVVLHVEGRRWIESWGRRWPAILAISAALILIVCGFQKQTGWIIALETASSAYLIAAIAFDRRSQLFAFLDFPLSIFYGRISYSFYLLHMVGLSLALRMTRIDGWPVASGLLSAAVAVLLTTPLAWLSWRCIERPFVRLGRKLDERGGLASRAR